MPPTSPTPMLLTSELGDVVQVVAAGYHLGESCRRPERAEGHDQRRHLPLGDDEAVDDAPGGAARYRDDDPEQSGGPAIAGHHLPGNDAGEHQHRADRQVNARRDDDEGLADRHDEQDGRADASS